MTGVAKMTQNGNLSKGPCFWKHHRIQSPRHPPRSFMLVQAHETLNTNRRQSQYNLIFPTEIYSTEYKIRSTWNHVWKCLKLYPNAECKKNEKKHEFGSANLRQTTLGQHFFQPIMQVVRARCSVSVKAMFGTRGHTGLAMTCYQSAIKANQGLHMGNDDGPYSHLIGLSLTSHPIPTAAESRTTSTCRKLRNVGISSIAAKCRRCMRHHTSNTSKVKDNSDVTAGRSVLGVLKNNSSCAENHVPAHRLRSPCHLSSFLPI